MKLELLFFGALAESLNCRSRSLNLQTDALNLSELVDTLASQGGPWENFRDKYQQGQIKAAVNQELQTCDRMLKTFDEIAFFPPVTGG